MERTEFIEICKNEGYSEKVAKILYITGLILKYEDEEDDDVDHITKEQVIDLCNDCPVGSGDYDEIVEAVDELYPLIEDIMIEFENPNISKERSNELIANLSAIINEQE